MTPHAIYEVLRLRHGIIIMELDTYDKIFIALKFSYDTKIQFFI